MASLPDGVRKAHDFELSYRAHPSVTEDSFYKVPPDTSDATPGTLLKIERETDTSSYTLAPNLSLSRFIYQSKTSNGIVVPVSAYILWPYIARDYGDGHPFVIWAHGTSGNNDESAPSNNQHLWHHFQAPYQLALLGFVVVATDYAGLGVGSDASGKPIVHEYLNGRAHANDVAYSIPAAQAAFPELSKRFVVVGSSQGGLAAWGFAKKIVHEPIDGYLGTVAFHLVTSLLSLPADSAVIPLLLLMVAPSLIANYPGFQPSEIFTPKGEQNLETHRELKGCNTVLYNLPSGDILKDGWQNNPTVQAWQEKAAVGGKPISGPMLVIQGGSDAVITPESVTNAISSTMRVSPAAQVEYHLLPNISHAPAMYAGLQIYIDWISARFSGQPMKLKERHGFSRYEHQPVRPASAQQVEANWFIQKQAGPWQAT